jgi:hypothetical protein
MNLENYLINLRTLEKEDKTIYKYDCYKYDGKNLVYIESLDRSEFELRRGFNRVIFAPANSFSLRNIIKADKYCDFDCVIEERQFQNERIENESKKIFDTFLDDFIDFYKITKINEFKQFIEEYYNNDPIRYDPAVVKIHMRYIHDELLEKEYLLKLFL